VAEDQPDPIATGEAADPAQALFTEFQDLVYNYCFRRTGYFCIAEELTSEVFAVICKHVKEGRLPDPVGAPWLIGIAKKILKKSRPRIAKHQKELDGLEQVPLERYYDDPAAAVAAKVDAERAMRKLKSALDRLPPKQREVIELCASLNDKDVAEVLQIPVGTVKSRYSRAKEKLKEFPETSAAYEILFGT
jgi:RNA polymerase sigma factor (sigma-70 family)